MFPSFVRNLAPFFLGKQGSMLYKVARSMVNNAVKSNASILKIWRSANLVKVIFRDEVDSKVIDLKYLRY